MKEVFVNYTEATERGHCEYQAGPFSDMLLAYQHMNTLEHSPAVRACYISDFRNLLRVLVPPK